ncbi:MRP-L47-domain-containing protein [Wolfiporia cocos MD-104 SS10]|uniref:Large ribosomal subunit protein uL29m n=1 Tax=Wolfiporia cocos (strain MD-104) TaxID=742152 RepID=A0A2H3JVA5_WOLCO|nr:MRP-L47-domain-containing protein [Wolfiporia cocos MD-104 SS10]
MLNVVHPTTLRLLRSLPRTTRCLATHATVLPETSSVPATTNTENTPSTSTNKSKDGPLRPHLNITVDPNHGLWAFFRRKETHGEVSYETVEAPNPSTDMSGRSWTAAELRRKSFKDLHTLWYVLLRERNLLQTQEEEARRLGIHSSALSSRLKAFKCRKSMARLKYVLNERRLVYQNAVDSKNAEWENEAIIETKRKERAERKQAAQAQAEAEAREAERRKEESEAQSAVGLAGAGLFDTVQENTQTKES